ncbi:hypothetical protein ACRRTK_016543 [Alexandromys fortis]
METFRREGQARVGLARGKQSHVLPMQVRRCAAQPPTVSRATPLHSAGSTRAQGPLDHACCLGSNSLLLMVTASSPSESPGLLQEDDLGLVKWVSR